METPARSHYIESLLSSKPKYITTLREDYTQWETWVRHTKWWFYREFIRDYKPVEATFHNIIWQRLENLKKQVYPLAICRVDKESNDKTIINVLTNKQRNDISYYAEISLKYYLEVKPSGIPIVGKRELLMQQKKRRL